ncbi:spermine/spermidine synthase domain-containing protein [Salinivirga cyanobacteriivorans]
MLNFLKSKDETSKTLKPAVGAGLIASSFIGLEILWTRIFSAEYFYTFAFLVLSLSILGLGLGALVIRLFQKLGDHKKLWMYLTLGAVISIAGPMLVLQFDLNFTEIFGSWLMAGKIALVIIILSISFLFGGMSLGIIFKNHHTQMPKIYMSDLIGSGMGVVIAVLLMNIIEVQKTAFLVSVPALTAAILYAKKWRKTIPITMIVALLALLPKAETWLNKPREERFELIYQHWDAMAQLKVLKRSDNFYYSVIDNAAHAPTIGFDGNYNKPDSLKKFPGYPMPYMVKRYDSCTFLALGAGGGGDVLNALNSGATEIHAVEVVPHLNNLMEEGFLHDFTGEIYSHKNVKVITEDGRAYVKQFENKFDIIYSLSSNTFASLASGAFALAENYLFTKEAFEDYYDAMTEDGIMLLDHQFYIPRLTTAVIQALKNKGVDDPHLHIAIFHSYPGRRKMMLIGKKPLKKEVINNAFPSMTVGNSPYLTEEYPNPPDSLKNNLVSQIIKHGWEQIQDTVATDLSPTTDDRPFAAQMGLWKNFDIGNIDKISPYEFKGFPVAKLLILVILLVVGLIVIPINLIPFLKKGNKLTFNGWSFFFLIGVAFMAIEVILIQKYTRFIGPGSYTFVTILFTLLLASGIGSRFSQNFKSSIPFIGIILWVLSDIFLFEYLLNAVDSFPMFGRILITIILILPLGFFMGMPFPKGTKRVGELIDWGFAINGAASVLGSTAIMLVAFNFGYNMALLAGAAAYLLAMLIARSQKKWITE